MSILSELIEFINKHENGDSIFRKDIIKIGNLNRSSIDVYRKRLELCGYLDGDGGGSYLKIKDIPLDLTTSKLQKEAYKKNDKISLKKIFVRYHHLF